MKLLLDQNLSHRIVAAMAAEFPGSKHVRSLDLDRADDSAIWSQAAAEGYTIVSKDDDFNQRSLLLGPPPKVVWIRLGNCTTDAVIDALRESAVELRAFEAEPEQSLMVITPAGLLRR